MTKTPELKYIPATRMLVMDHVEILFSTLKEPVGFKGDEEKKNYSATFKIGKDHAQEFTKKLKEIEDKIVEDYKKHIETTEGKAKVKGLVQASVKAKDIFDRTTGDETGDIRVDTKRRELSGPPTVYDKDQNKIDVNYLLKGTVVRTAVELRPYKMGSTVGVSYQLATIFVREDAGRSGGGGSKGIGAAEAALFDFDNDLDKLPF